jgi:polyphosphate kinase 2
VEGVGKSQRVMGKKDKSKKKEAVIENGEEIVNVKKKKSAVAYEEELEFLQVELLKMQNHIKEKGMKLVILFEGRDASGKGGTIKRITEHINPRGARVVALEKPSDVEKTQWYFQRYIKHLPGAGEIVLFDRSWYNRGGVEPVMGFCTAEEHATFLKEVPKLEAMLISSKIILIKFYFSVSKDEQAKRFRKRETDPLKQYKLSPVDKLSQQLWDKYTVAKYSMLLASHTNVAPWTIIRSNNKKLARLNAIKEILKRVDYEDKYQDSILFDTDPEIVINGADEIVVMEQKFQ